jgi:hypothetical protein
VIVDCPDEGRLQALICGGFHLGRGVSTPHPAPSSAALRERWPGPPGSARIAGIETRAMGPSGSISREYK